MNVHVTRAFRMIRSPTLIGVQELQAVDGRRDQQAARVPMAGDGAGDVDEVHDRAAEDEPERIRVVRQHDLHHLGGGVGGALRREVHGLGLGQAHGLRPTSAEP